MNSNGKKDKTTGFLTTQNTKKLSNGINLTTKDEWDSANMRWTMTRTWKEKGKTKSYHSKARLYTLTEFKYLLESHGFEFIKAWGDFKGSPYDYESRRMIILARKK